MGRVELVASDGPPREIAGPDCEAVARALAIALAVMIDPEADLSGHAEELPPMDPPAPEPRGIDEAPPEPGPRTAERRRYLVVNVPPERRATPIVTLEGSAAATTGVVGGLLPVLGATVELAPASRPRVPWLRPSVGVGVRQSLPRDLDTSGFVTEFLWSAGVLRLCPVRFTAMSDRLELIPCFETHAGVLRANAQSSVAAPTSTRPWLDFGGSARVTYHIGRTWFAGASFAVVVPYTRYRFELSDRASVSQAPPTGVTFGGCAGVRF